MNQRHFIFYLLFCGLLFGFACKSKQKTEAPVTQKTNKKKSSKKSSSSQAKTTSSKPVPSNSLKSNAKEEELKRILGISSKEIKKNELYLFIEDWYGTPYKYGGCKKTGVDCSCFTNILYEEVYHKKLFGNADALYKSSDKISLSRAKEGDLVFLKLMSLMFLMWVYYCGMIILFMPALARVLW